MQSNINFKGKIMTSQIYDFETYRFTRKTKNVSNQIKNPFIQINTLNSTIQFLNDQRDTVKAKLEKFILLNEKLMNECQVTSKIAKRCRAAWDLDDLDEMIEARDLIQNEFFEVMPK